MPPSNPIGGQLDNLPEKPKNLHYIWNQGIKKFDVIDLDTGKMYDPIDYHVSAIKYSPLMADVICAQIREGKTLQTICQEPDMPSITRFYSWLALNPELRVKYEQARKQRADRFHDQAIELALSMPHKDMVPGVKLAIDTLKWAAEKANPDYYGKKETDGPKGTSISITLHTGVLDSTAPKDIVVDEFGNFKGFADDSNSVQDGVTIVQEESTIELSTNRWETIDKQEDSDGEER